MLRMAIIAVLTLATVLSAGVWVASYCGVTRTRYRRSFGSVDVGISRRHGVWIGFPAPDDDNLTQPLGIEVKEGRWFISFLRGHQPPWTKRVDWQLPGGGLTVVWKGMKLFDLDWHFRAWVPCVLFGAYPLYALVRSPARRRRRRRKQGLCIDCGYDLTGNESGVCSECGSKIEQP